MVFSVFKQYPGCIQGTDTAAPEVGRTSYGPQREQFPSVFCFGHAAIHQTRLKHGARLLKTTLLRSWNGLAIYLSRESSPQENFGKIRIV